MKRSLKAENAAKPQILDRRRADLNESLFEPPRPGEIVFKTGSISAACYARVLGDAAKTDHRWRVEHAQVVAPEEFPRFAALGVIASMQPTHAT